MGKRQRERLGFLNRGGHAPKLKDTLDGSTEDGYILTWSSSDLSFVVSAPSSATGTKVEPLIPLVESRIVFNKDSTVIATSFAFNTTDYTAGSSFYLESVISSVGGQTVRARLYNFTDGEYVANASVSTTAENPTTLISSALTSGASSGNLKNSSKTYEIRLDVDGATAARYGIVYHVGLRVV